jgi:ABC-type transport system involved in multi-copper enzyme maturation permease subunit
MSGAALVVAQTGVIFLDAFRELNARKMFWISMAIAALVVSVFGVLGINAKGVTVLWFTLEVPLFNTGLMSVGTFYKMLFASVGIELWLGWASTILALVSSASLIPDFVGSGQIESMVARPIGRVRLFLTKYVAGLLFVFLQALVFTLAAVVLIGLRSGEWMWTLLAAVPIVTLFFSYLFCVSALVGVWTRSTLAALAAALAVWGCVLAVGVADNIVIGQTFSAERQANLMRADVQATALQVTRLEQDGATPERMADLRAGLERREREVAAKEKSLETLKFWGRVSATARTILPKTGETKDLIARLAISDEEMARFMDAADQDPRGGGGPFGDRATLRHVENVNKGRSVWWIVGTSLLFQGMVLGAACYVFARRDF